LAFTLCGVAILFILHRESLMHFGGSRPRLFDAITRTIEGLASAALVALATHEILLR